MGTITNNVTRINDLDGSPTTVSVGGGQGATTNTDIFIQGVQSVARRTSGTTLGGFLVDNGVSFDLTGRHLGLWVWVTHYSVLTELRVRVTGSNSNNYNDYQLPLSEVPAGGGWIRIWIDPTQTPTATGGTGLTVNSTRLVGPIISIPSVGGNAQNNVMDTIDTTSSTAGGLTVTGASSTFNDFVSFDTGSGTAQYGVVSSNAGILFCRGRITIGNATATSFSDSNFSIVFPQQSLVSNTFMGLTLNLTNASTSVLLSSGAISSPGTKKGDLIVTGTGGTATLDGCTLSGLRTLSLNNRVTIQNSTFAACGNIVLGGAIISGSTFNTTNVSGGSILTATNDIGNVTGSTFIKGAGVGHAIQITTPGTYTFDGLNFSGYGAGGTTSAAIYNNSGGSVTINITGGGNTPTVRNGTGASTTVNNAKTFSVTNIQPGSEVRIFRQSDLVELAGVENVTTASGVNNVTLVNDPDNAGRYKISYSYNHTADIPIYVVCYNVDYLPIRQSSTLRSTDGSLLVTQLSDRQYARGTTFNPT